MYMSGGMLHDTLLQETLPKAEKKEGVTPPHILIQSDTNFHDTNRTTKEKKYLWIGKDEICQTEKFCSGR